MNRHRLPAIAEAGLPGIGFVTRWMKLLRTIGAVLFIGLALTTPSPVYAAPAATVYTGFTGPYDVGNWTIAAPGDGSVDTTGAPDSIVLLGRDDENGDGGNVDFTINALLDGAVYFDWYWTGEISSAWDPFGVLLNGVFRPLTDEGVSGVDQSGSSSFAFSAGDVWGFRQNSRDGFDERAITTISNFVVVPEPASLALLVTGSLLLVRRNRHA